jgi:hypothetical protein
MKRFFALLLVVSLMGCSTTTLIKTDPPGARVMVDGAPLGITPCKYDNGGPFWIKNAVLIEKDGYQPINTVLTKSQPNVMMIILACGVIVPALWATGYPDEFNYELQPLKTGNK